MIKTLSCRLYPNASQQSRLVQYLYVTRTLYNHSLEQRILYYKTTGKTLTRYEQQKDLTVLRGISQVLGSIPAIVERFALDRLEKSFSDFFRRVRSGKEKPGYPRFKSSKRWNSVCILSPGDIIKKNGRIRVPGVDGLIVSRGLVENVIGSVKVQRLVLRGKRWFCQIVVDDGMKLPPKVPVKSSIGIDLGLKSFAAMSNGELIENPRFYRKYEKKLNKLQASLSRKKTGSANRSLAVSRLRDLYSRIVNLRHDFTNKLSRRIINNHQFIAVEDLNIAGMAKNTRLSKSILDAAWGQFLYQLDYKAESAGCRVVKVNPSGTSQDCSSCGQRVQKELSVRVHICQHCGLVADRDVNAATNILQRALAATSAAGVAGSNACGGATKLH